jgi:hypothetical protein
MNAMNTENLTKEQHILRAMRKVLASIARDTATGFGKPSVLTDSTKEEIRDCFGIISEREAELAEALGLDRNEKPYFSDDPKKSNVISFFKPE